MYEQVFVTSQVVWKPTVAHSDSSRASCSDQPALDRPRSGFASTFDLQSQFWLEVQSSMPCSVLLRCSLLIQMEPAKDKVLVGQILHTLQELDLPVHFLGANSSTMLLETQAKLLAVLKVRENQNQE
ncbi:small ribosomal subunit protein bS1m-like [Centropristis striata]|uniref:small ribosomal subunit protein bS1m-like n=1 Tax=Centropristis striata TaxID=184440 RepID=UPI0027DF6D9C|nr:small ribosomal subunit protein bS1m-like [Centropristis striata]